MLRNFLVVLINSMLLLATLNGFAQQRTCGAMEVLQKKMAEDTNLSEKMRKIEQVTAECVRRSRKNNERIAGPVTIPVVVHVIYQTEAQNITDAQILSQIEVLNKDFRRTNTDADNIWPQAADTQIEFCMANIDPNGDSTDGITRKFVDRSSWGSNDAMKNPNQSGVAAWPTEAYLNMWVCNIGGGILGYAQFPGGEATTDGVVISPQFFGTLGSAQAPFNGGRTTTHEVGHWLNLRHIWGDGPCVIDDFIEDTPASDAPNYSCATGHLSCETTDMVQNYMDYSDDACMNLFTAGQKERMRALFDPEGFRANLLNSTACGGGDNNSATCTDGIQNQNETGIDCGGACPDCPTGCANEVELLIKFDNYPEETSWEIKNEAGEVVASAGPYTNQEDGSTVTIVECLENACYDLIIKDSYKDGMCCRFGNGAYSLTTTADGVIIAAGETFTDAAITNFCLGSPQPTCEDGIQNQEETGVDCGGPCQPCTESCNAIDITLKFDDYPEENSWKITNAAGALLFSGGPYDAQPDGSTLSITECLVDGCYDFTIKDAYSDGMCCGYGNGAYSISAGGNTLASGANFTASETSNFCFNAANENDCSYKILNSEDFETGWGIWNDGGSDSYRNNYAPYASSGSYTIRIRDDSFSSFMTTDNINATTYQKLKVGFSYYPVELEEGEAFWLQLSTDGGNTFTTIKTWAKGSNFENSTAYRESVIIEQQFSATTKIRLRVDASVNSDRVYFDDVEISACGL